MARENINLPVDPMAAALAGNTSTEVQREMLEYFKTANQVLKEKAESDRAERAALEKQLQTKMVQQAKAAQEAEKARQAQERAQANCAHYGERGQSLIFGFRVGGGKYAFRCTDCGKFWDNLAAIQPAQLRPSSIHIGGPTSY